MITCEYAGPSLGEPRSHPWSESAIDPLSRYYDLTAFPELTHTVLEDFVPFSGHPAIETFYQLLSLINTPDCALETNDCAFNGIHANDNPAVFKNLQCSGRVMILFRALRRNLIPAEMEHLSRTLHGALVRRDTLFRFGIVGTTIVPVRYHLLSTRSSEQLGTQLMISFWAYGNTEVETMNNLGRLMKNLAASMAQLLTTQPTASV